MFALFLLSFVFKIKVKLKLCNIYSVFVLLYYITKSVICNFLLVDDSNIHLGTIVVPKEAAAVIKIASSRMATQSERLGYEFAKWLGVRSPQVIIPSDFFFT